jgi:hypothetical protein
VCCTFVHSAPVSCRLLGDLQEMGEGQPEAARAKDDAKWMDAAPCRGDGDPFGQALVKRRCRGGAAVNVANLVPSDHGKAGLLSW